jgi:hypothetical protein
MVIEVTGADAGAADADLIAVAVGGRSASQLGVPERAAADPDPAAIVNRDDLAPLAFIALEPDIEGLRTAAARAVRAC